MTDENLDASTTNAAPDSMLALTTKIVAAYISKNSMPGTELPALIDRVFQSLASITTASTTPAPQARPDPAVPVRKSSYGLTPEAYRERWGLPSNYPMVAPSYAEKRSTLAKSIGLGQKSGKAKAAE